MDTESRKAGIKVIQPPLPPIDYVFCTFAVLVVPIGPSVQSQALQLVQYGPGMGRTDE